MTNDDFLKLEDKLKRLEYLKEMISQDKATLDECYGTKGMNYDRECVAPTNKFNSETENTMMQRSQIENRIIRNTDITRRINSALNMLDKESRNIIESFYIQDQGWETIIRSNNSSVRRCQRKRDLAMINIHEYLYDERIIDKKNG